MNLIALVAELIANGIDLECHEGILYFIGEFNALPLSLQLELSAHQRDLTAWANSNPMEAPHVV